MRIFVSIIMIFTFAFAASGLAKSLSVQSIDNRVVEMQLSSEVLVSAADRHSCCAEETVEHEHQKPRCIADNLIIADYVPLTAAQVAEQHDCFAIISSSYVLKKRSIRPPIA